MTGAEWLCFDNAAYASCLLSTKAPTILAKGSIWVYVGNYDADDGQVTFDLKTKILAL